MPGWKRRTGSRCGRAARVGFAGLVLLAVAWATPAAAQQPDEAPDPIQMDIMSTVSVRAPTLAAFPRWQTALAIAQPWMSRMQACLDQPCQDLSVVEKVWLSRTQAFARLPVDKRAGAVAGFLNELLNVPPEAMAEAPEGPWPSMRDILAGGGRNGLGLALARYFTLQASGIDPAHLRLMIGRDTLTQDRTFVVEVETSEGRLALTRYGVQWFSGRDTQPFIPIYAFNHQNRWLYFLDEVLEDIPTSDADASAAGGGAEEALR